MEVDERVIKVLMAAGADALDFNAPLGPVRAGEIVARLAEADGTVVDLGCGRAGLLARFLARYPHRAAIGVDNDPVAIESRRSDPTTPAGLTLVAADAASWQPPTDDVGAVVAVGVSHAFGGAAAMLGRIGELCRGGIAIVGAGVWETAPDPWCSATFGDLPEGAAGLAELARAAGWTVAKTDLSTIAEWDAFEGGWLRGVRNVGTPAASVFADQREADYERYRGVLGFAWLELTWLASTRER